MDGLVVSPYLHQQQRIVTCFLISLLHKCRYHPLVKILMYLPLLHLELVGKIFHFETHCTNQI